MIEQIGTVAYRLDLPAHAKIHPVLHVSQLKPYHGETTGESYLLLPLHSIPMGPLCYPLQVQAMRHMQHDNKWVCQFLIRWDGPMEDSWEFEDDLHRIAPSLNLEVKALIYEGSIVMDQDQTDMKGTTEQAQKQMGQLRKSLRTKKKSWKLREMEAAEDI